MMDSKLLDLLQTGLRGAKARHSVIANNLANINTPGYRRQDVRFDEMLAEALRDPERANLAELQPELYEPRTTPVGANGNDVDLDGEIGALLKNTSRMKLCMRLMAKTYQQMKSAVSDTL